ncbi:MAG: cytidylate kinase [Marinibacterium sp.]|nr:cytidylate kinase [Marinibacterium sp.]
MSFTIAIDGPAAAGKGTLSRGIAEHFGLAHLDTGLLYRAVGARVRDGDEAVAAAQSLTQADLARDDLRSADVAQAASVVAAIPEVRAALVAFQRSFARRDGGAVLDGRDIGTVICPDAEVKLYVTASAEVRATRRFHELQAGGSDTTYDAVLEDVKARDHRDANRAEAPMKPADDAVILDTSDLDIGTVLAQAIKIVGNRR